ncbi:MAG TPA: outer membrane beta-barrel family protein [Bacteroidia bacterium]|nr:outer membrane beta-barrel family protein [Bacteroidia bacterium]
MSISFKVSILSTKYFLILCLLDCKAQYAINGKVVDKKRVSAEFVTVTIQKDSAFIASTVTDSLGLFNFKSLSNRNYKLHFYLASTINYELDISLNKDTFIFVQPPIDTLTLKETVIQAKQTIYERKIDRLVFNIDRKVNAALGDALSALKQTPGVNVQSEAISMAGKSQVLVMIDDRPVKLSGTDLLNFLKTIPSSDIAKIEAIHTPPAKYEAEGNSGIINIRLKQLKRDTWNAYANGSFKQNTYANEGLNGAFNWKKNKFSLGTNLSGSISKNADVSQQKICYPSFLWDASTVGFNSNRSIAPKIGMDYNITKKWKTGIQYIGAINNPSGMFKTSINAISQNSDELGIINSEGNSNGTKNIHSINWNNNILIDTLGKKLTVDVDYLNFNSSDQQTFSTRTNTAVVNISPMIYESYNKISALIRNIAAQADMEHPGKRYNLNYGIKLAHTKTDNTIQYTNSLISGEANTSSQFTFNENIQALYGSVYRAFNEKWSVKAGLRLEHTNTFGNSISSNEINKNDYFRLFPTLFINYTKSKDHSFSLAYNHRIRRPGFYELNPFKWYSSQYFYTEGNPLLKPFVTKNLILNYDFKNTLFFAVTLSNTVNASSQVPFVSAQDYTTEVQRLNYYDYNNCNFNVSYLFQKWSWFESQNEFNVYYIKSYSKIAPITPKTTEGYGAYIYSSNSFVLNKTGTLFSGVNLRYNFKGKTANFQTNFPTNSIDIFFKSSFLSGKLQVTVAVENLLKSNDFKNRNLSNTVPVEYTSYSDSRYIGASVVYKIGKGTMSFIKRKNSNQEEKDRTN